MPLSHYHTINQFCSSISENKADETQSSPCNAFFKPIPLFIENQNNAFLCIAFAIKNLSYAHCE